MSIDKKSMHASSRLKSGYMHFGWVNSKKTEIKGERSLLVWIISKCDNFSSKRKNSLNNGNQSIRFGWWLIFPLLGPKNCSIQEFKPFCYWRRGLIYWKKLEGVWIWGDAWFLCLVPELQQTWSIGEQSLDSCWLIKSKLQWMH